MDGSHQTYPPSVLVASPLLSNMPYCALGGCPSIRHNELRDLTASLQCNNVAVEPSLQPVSSEILRGNTNWCTPGHQSKWILGWTYESAFFDVRVFTLLLLQTGTLLYQLPIPLT